MTPITASQQFKAVAYLRWHLFRNGLRRKGGAGELAARILVYPIFAGFIIGPTVGAFGAALYAVEQDHIDYLAPVFWGIFALRLLVSINIAQPGLSFDPAQLIRFPLTFPRYLTIRVFLGLLSASTIIGTLALLGAATGITVADSTLAFPAFAVALTLAVADMFFIRMIFAWVDRWLATRRARELFTGVIILFSLGIQWLNFNFNPGFNHGHSNRAKVDAAMRAYEHATPFLHYLPPSLASAAIAFAAEGRHLLSLASLAAVLAWGAVFCFIFARRMHREYRGENLSETTSQNHPLQDASSASAPSPSGVQSGAPLATLTISPQETSPATPGQTLAPAPTLQAVLHATLAKEFLYVRRNTSQLYGLLAPLAMVFIVAARFGNSMGKSPWLLPAAAGYSTLGVAALAYNSLGLDGAGTQFYFLAPVRLGAIMLAKNLFSFALNLVSITLVVLVIIYNSGVPPLFTILNTLAWVVMASLINVTIGNIRSITAPKKIDPTKVSRRQASGLSALISLGIILAVGAAGGALMLLGSYLDKPWLPFLILLALAAVAALFYRQGLQSLDALAYRNRETMIEELTKAT